MSKIPLIKAKYADLRFRWKNEASTDVKMSTKEIWSFGFTEFSRNAGSVLMVGYINVILTIVFGIDPMAVGVMMTVSTAIEYFRDPIVSLFMDVTRSRWGRFRPYLVISAPLASILAIAFMLNPFETGNPDQLPYVYITYILWTLVFAVLNAAWNGIGLTITRNDDEKKRFFSIARGLSVISGLLPSTLPILMDLWNANGWSLRGLFVGMSIFCGVIACIAALFTPNLRERVTIPPESLLKNLKKNLKMVFRNKNAMILWIGSISSIFSTIAGIAGPYVFIYCYGAYSWQSLVWTIAGLAAWTLLFLSQKIFSKMSAKAVIYAFNLMNVVAWIVLYFTGYGTGTLYIVILVATRTFAASFEYLGCVATSMFNTDVWDHYEWKYGVRNENTTGLIGGYVTKPLGMLTNMLYGILFTAIGFTSGAQVQSQATMDWLFFIFTIFNAVGNLLTCLPYLLIKLDKKTMAKVRADLEERRKAKLVATETNKGHETFEIYG